MKIAIGSDHGGFRLKEEITRFLVEQGVEFQDFGCFSLDSVDYPDVALKVAKAVAAGKYPLGILICGTGIGVSIAANKVKGVRAALCHDTYSARMAREHNDANVLTMGGRVIGPDLAREVVRAFLGGQYSGEARHARRLAKISAAEGKAFAAENGGLELSEGEEKPCSTLSTTR
ncbi:MAG TPA: ribose 5-phosphate isomerase B [Firmicutes bacterium]|nr:ribose 5-phosphate isomerase B [Bacillota bacterium]